MTTNAVSQAATRLPPVLLDTVDVTATSGETDLSAYVGQWVLLQVDADVHVDFGDDATTECLLITPDRPGEFYLAPGYTLLRAITPSGTATLSVIGVG